MLVSKSLIFRWLRNLLSNSRSFGNLIECPICLSFWVALVMGLRESYSPTGSCLDDGCLAMGVTWILYSFCWGMALKDDRF
jgi:hypothetical protein